MGNSSSQIQADLDAAQKQLAAVSKQRSELQSENAAAAATIAEQKEQLSATVAACEAKLAEQTEALAAAVKKRQVAEDMRRSDALLCKRILAASSATREKAPPALVDGGAVANSARAAELALQANGELHARELLLAAGAQLEAAKAESAALQAAQTATLRRELSAALWPADLCDLSVSVRSSNLMVLGGVKLPRAGASAAPGIGVLRQFGDGTQQGRWAAVGGALSWDPRERQPAQLRVAACAKPASHLPTLTLGFDHKGLLTSTVAAARDALSVKLSGEVDVNGGKTPRARVELAYDLD